MIIQTVVAAEMLIILGATGAYADTAIDYPGLIQVSTGQYKPLPLGISKPTVALDSSDIMLDPASKNPWRFRFSRTKDVFAHVTLSVSNVPTGWTPYSVEMDMPFSWADEPRVLLVAAVVNDPNNDQGADALIVRAATLSRAGGGPADWVEVNQRAKKLFGARMATFKPGDPRKRDINIAFWVVFSSSYLVANRYITVDELTKSAQQFLLQQITRQAQGGGTLLIGDKLGTVTVAEVEDSVKNLDQRNSIIYNKVLHAISDRVERERSPDIEGTCPRAYSTENQFSRMSQEDLNEFNGAFANQIISYRVAARCRSAALQGHVMHKEKPQDGEIAAAQDTLDRLQAVLDSRPSPDKPEFAGELDAARKRMHELQDWLLRVKPAE